MCYLLPDTFVDFVVWKEDRITWEHREGKKKSSIGTEMIA